MRKINLNAVEASIAHSAINMGDPQRGLSLQEIRDLSPLLDMIETTCVGEGMNRKFNPVELILKENQFETLKNKIERSTGWRDVESGRFVDRLAIKIKDIPFIEEEKVKL